MEQLEQANTKNFHIFHKATLVREIASEEIRNDRNPIKLTRFFESNYRPSSIPNVNVTHLEPYDCKCKLPTMHEIIHNSQFETSIIRKLK